MNLTRVLWLLVVCLAITCSTLAVLLFYTKFQTHQNIFAVVDPDGHVGLQVHPGDSITWQRYQQNVGSRIAFDLGLGKSFCNQGALTLGPDNPSTVCTVREKAQPQTGSIVMSFQPLQIISSTSGKEKPRSGPGASSCGGCMVNQVVRGKLGQADVEKPLVLVSRDGSEGTVGLSCTTKPDDLQVSLASSDPNISDFRFAADVAFTVTFRPNVTSPNALIDPCQADPSTAVPNQLTSNINGQCYLITSPNPPAVGTYPYTYQLATTCSSGSASGSGKIILK